MYFRTLLFVFLTIIFIPHGLHAQSCLPDGITFGTQGQIDSFWIDYPGCSAIEGNVFIIEDGCSNLFIENLDGLLGLTSIGGDLRIGNNATLPNLDGLSNLTTIGGELQISFNNYLHNIDGLSSLISVGGDINVYFNNYLMNVDGLSGLTSMNGDISIHNSFSLTNVDGLSGLTSMDGSIGINNNHSLTNVDGLSGLTSVGGDLYIAYNEELTRVDGLSGLKSVGGDLTISSNTSLPDVDGLFNLTSVGENLLITYNDKLTDCCGIQDLLASSGVGDVIVIHDNPSECSSESEILAADCVIGTLSPKVNTSSLLLSPNPVGEVIRVSLEGAPAHQQAHLMIVNPLGQTVLDRPRFRLGEAINIRHLPKGLFTVRIETEANIFLSRLVKN